MFEDKYRWLEDKDSKKCQNWIEEENKKTKEYFNNIDEYDLIKKRIKELMNFKEYSFPKIKNNKYYYFKRKGLMNQPKLYELDGKNEKEIIDPNSFSDDGTVAITNYFPDNSGRYIAYTRAESGSDRQEIYIYDMENKEEIKEKIKWLRFSTIAWKNNSSGFYYNRFPEPKKVKKEDENNYSKIYWHKLGTSQDEDKLIYEDKNNKKLNFHPILSENEKYLILNVTKGTASENGIYYRETEGKEEFKKLFKVMDAEYNFIGNKDSIFYFKTNKDANNAKIISVDIDEVKNNKLKNYINNEIEYISDVIAERETILKEAKLINDKIFAVYLVDASHQIKIFNLKGNIVNEFKDDMPLTIDQLSYSSESNEAVFVIQSFLKVPTIYSYDAQNNYFKKIKEPNYDFDFDKYKTEQYFYKSKDNTKIPMYISSNKNMKKDGKNAAILYGYGGFDISLTPTFSPTTLFWLERGGFYALANIRGGGEYGSEWHKAGMLEKKQNVFDDFIAAAEWLIDNGYSNNDKLAIWGRSNGGLLVTATMIQRPELFAAVVSNVPVTDMLRFHKFTVGSYWIPEYGNPDNPDHYKFLSKYSPLHNLEDGRDYPSVIVGTADTDDRVVPLHSRKFTKALNDADKGNNIKLFRMEKKAGHGFAKPTSKIIEERSDFYTFLLKELKEL